jgi:molybdopterin-binding protein
LNRIEAYRIVRTMPNPPELLSPSAAARELGVSYPTIKQWIYHRRIRSRRTPGGHHRIPRSEVARLAGTARRESGPEQFAISGRNKLSGTVVGVRLSGLMAEVVLDLGGQQLTAIITSAAARELRLRRGVEAVALIKATEVMIFRG